MKASGQADGEQITTMNTTDQPQAVACIRFVRRPDVAGWWYDTKTERWRWCFEDPGMGFCARESKSDAGHFWKVSNYKPESNRWYGPWSLPSADSETTSQPIHTNT